MSTVTFPAPKRILAFDPGDVWCGMAALDWDNGEDIVAESRVIHLASRSLLGFLRYIDFMLPAYVVCEDFRVQAVGHNRFSAGHTLRLIGALETITVLNPKSRWAIVPPGNAKREVPELFNGWYERWEAFRNDRDANWRHAQSAWRVMGRFLMSDHPKLLRILRKEHRVQPMKPWLGIEHIDRRHDLTSPALRTLLTR